MPATSIKPANKWPEQLFILGDEAVMASSPDEVWETAKAMTEMGLYKDPFENYVIQVKGKFFGQAGVKPQNPELPISDSFKNADFRFHIVGVDVDRVDVFTYINSSYKGDRWISLYECMGITTREIESLCYTARRYLIVLLATKNVAKSTKVDKLVRHGIGKAERHLATKRRFAYTTTITIGPEAKPEPEPEPKLEPKSEPKPEPKHYRPHLRRGHIRQQPYGPNLQFHKQVFIQPVFVNQDREWSEPLSRDHYNIGHKKEPVQ
jgi:hypothetical protein